MRKLIFAAVFLLLLTNIVVLAGVAYNRSGDPFLSIELTERELPMVVSVRSKDENSGTTLSLKWHILSPDKDPEYLSTTYGRSAWLNDKKLTELGFDMKKFKSEPDKYRHRTSHLATEAVLVLEYQGETYLKALALVKEKVKQLRLMVAEYPDDKKQVNDLSNYEKQLTRLKLTQSRLYAVDAGLDVQALMDKYTDKNNYLLVRGEIGLGWSEDDVSGRIRQLYIRHVHVPLPISEQLVTLANGEAYASHRNSSIPARYKVRLNIGKRLEPWIESVTQISKPGSENSIKPL